MNITLKLTPFVSEQYALEQNFLRIPVSFTYENKEKYFTHTITDGLPIIGKINPDTREMSYFVGNNCTIEQLTEFVENLSRNLPSVIVFNENDDFVNSIEYDPSNETWKHKTGSKMTSFGSVLVFKITMDTIKQFREAFDNYRRFAFMQIEGHKRLIDMA